MSYTIEVNTVLNSEPEIVIRIQSPLQYITVPVDMTHSETIQVLLKFAADAGEEPILRFSDGTPAIHMIRDDGVEGFFGDGAMTAIMPTKRI